MAESEPAAVDHSPASAGLLASAAPVVRPNTKLIALLAVVATRFLPAPRVQEVR